MRINKLAFAFCFTTAAALISCGPDSEPEPTGPQQLSELPETNSLQVNDTLIYTDSSNTVFTYTVNSSSQLTETSSEGTSRTLNYTFIRNSSSNATLALEPAIAPNLSSIETEIDNQVDSGSNPIANSLTAYIGDNVSNFPQFKEALENQFSDQKFALDSQNNVILISNETLTIDTTTNISSINTTGFVLEGDNNPNSSVTGNANLDRVVTSNLTVIPEDVFLVGSIIGNANDTSGFTLQFLR